jgi:hypothetical protein
MYNVSRMVPRLRYDVCACDIWYMIHDIWDMSSTRAQPHCGFFALFGFDSMFDAGSRPEGFLPTRSQ